MNLVCIHGRARSGKDELAKVLSKDLGLKVCGLADPIKDIGDYLYGWCDDHREGYLKEKTVKTRWSSLGELEVALNSVINKERDIWGVNELDKALSLFSNKVVRKFAPSWVMPIFWLTGKYYLNISPREFYQLLGTEVGRSVKSSTWLDVSVTPDKIIKDVRFKEELEYTKSKGALIIKVISNRETIKSNHTSESFTADNAEVHLVLHNNGTLDDWKLTSKKLAGLLQESGYTSGSGD
jgi:hypothetical protein